jgi:hypothetical protein
MPNTGEKNTLLDKGLPVVSNQTLDAVYEVYAGKKWGIHLTELREILLRDNPNLVKFIERQVGKYPRKLHDSMFEIILGTIAVLRLQGMVDQKRGDDRNK